MVCVVELILFYVFLDFKVKCMLISSPCMETQYWDNYGLQCFDKQSIYITRHICTDDSQHWTPPDNTSGCQERIFDSCSFSLPIEGKISDYTSPFASAVSKCNNRKECTLQSDYFAKIDSNLRSLCKGNLNISFLQSIEYDCISDSQIVKNCSGVTGSRSGEIYLQFFDNFFEQPCHIYADVSKAEILQTYATEVRISSNGILVYDLNSFAEHLDSTAGLYGVRIPLCTNNLIIDLRGESAYSYTLLKLEVKKSSRIVFEVGQSHGSIKSVEKETYTSAVIWIPTILTTMLILLVLFSICQQRWMYVKRNQQRMQHSGSAVIDIADTDDKLVFRLETKREGGDINVEMHKAGCLCEQTSSCNTREISHHSSIPSIHVSTLNNTMGSEQDLSDAESEPYINMLLRI